MLGPSFDVSIGLDELRGLLRDLAPAIRRAANEAAYCRLPSPASRTALTLSDLVERSEIRFQAPPSTLTTISDTISSSAPVR
ncbi:unnamed protein product [Rhizoctonia solani]|uniref:Uncharacterized protein n=1 Tax=Rhizoctonia solani TaxID=456999 RepID=A0A8H2XSI8_9AGAM|nr:unnamed protein product [Rhizoctonia solani]